MSLLAQAIVFFAMVQLNILEKIASIKSNAVQYQLMPRKVFDVIRCERVIRVVMSWYHGSLQKQRYRQVLIGNARSEKFQSLSRNENPTRQKFFRDRSLRSSPDRQNGLLRIFQETPFARRRSYGLDATAESVFRCVVGISSTLDYIEPVEDVLYRRFRNLLTGRMYSSLRLAVAVFGSSARVETYVVSVRETHEVGMAF